MFSLVIKLKVSSKPVSISQKYEIVFAEIIVNSLHKKLPLKLSATIIFWLLSFLSLFGQHSIKGKVIDEKSKTGLAFVNIIDNNNNGATTDIDGNFSINSSQPINNLKLVMLVINQQNLT